MLDKMINAYVEQFDENFPIFCLMGKSDSELIDIIAQCLKDGKPYDTSDVEPLKVLY